MELTEAYTNFGTVDLVFLLKYHHHEVLCITSDNALEIYNWSWQNIHKIYTHTALHLTIYGQGDRKFIRYHYKI